MTVLEFDMFFDEGISRSADLLNTGSKLGVIQRSGSWFSYADQKLGQGMEASKKFLNENAKIADKIAADIKKSMQESVVA